MPKHDKHDAVRNAAQAEEQCKKKIDVALNMKPKQAIGHGNNGRLTTGNFSLETWQMGAPDRMPDCENHRYIKEVSKRWVNQIP